MGTRLTQFENERGPDGKCSGGTCEYGIDTFYPQNQVQLLPRNSELFAPLISCARLLDGCGLEYLVAEGWERLGERINIHCFNYQPTINSSLKFLRKTDWARAKVERLSRLAQLRRAEGQERTRRRAERHGQRLGSSPPQRVTDAGGFTVANVATCSQASAWERDVLQAPACWSSTQTRQEPPPQCVPRREPGNKRSFDRGKRYGLKIS